MTHTRARGDIVRLQRRLTRRLETSVRELVGLPSPALKVYERRYKRDSSRYRSVSSFDELVASCAGARVVLCGDYHSYVQSQRTALRVLERLASRPRRWVLCLEMIRRTDQPHLERYQAGTLDEPGFLEAVDFGRNWGFNWLNCRPLFEFARAHGLPVQGINTSADVPIENRDGAMARHLARIGRDHPDHGLFVLVGDMHLAEPHLPRQLRPRLEAEGPLVRVLQNCERLYWELARKGLELGTDVVRLDDHSFCVLSGTPWTKLESYLSWLENGENLLARIGNQTHADPQYLTDQLLELAETVARFLGLGAIGLDDFSAHTLDDLGSVSEILCAHLESQTARDAVLASEVCVLPGLDLIFLTRLDIGHLAEAAAEYVHVKVSRSPRETCLRGADAFGRRLLRKALASFGSRLINPKRRLELPSPSHWHGWARRDRTTASRALASRYASSVLQALTSPDATRASRRLLDAAADDDLRLGLGISARAGRMVGAALFEAYTRGDTTRKELEELYRTSPDGAHAWLMLRRLYAPDFISNGAPLR